MAVVLFGEHVILPADFAKPNSNKTVMLKTQMSFVNMNKTYQEFPTLPRGRLNTCTIDPGIYKSNNTQGKTTYHFMCVCHDDNCNGSPSFSEALPELAKRYYPKEVAQVSFWSRDVVWIVIIILGCGLAFITLALIIVTIIKKRRLEDEFESSIHPDEHDVSIKDEEERKIPDVQLMAASQDAGSPDANDANGDEKSSLISKPLPTALPPKYSP